MQSVWVALSLHYPKFFQRILVLWRFQISNKNSEIWWWTAWWPKGVKNKNHRLSRSLIWSWRIVGSHLVKLSLYCTLSFHASSFPHLWLLLDYTSSNQQNAGRTTLMMLNQHTKGHGYLRNENTKGAANKSWWNAFYIAKLIQENKVIAVDQVAEQYPWI